MIDKVIFNYKNLLRKLPVSFSFFFILLAFFQPRRQFMFRSQRTTFKDRFGARFKIADEGFEIYFLKSSWSHSCKISIQLQDS